MAAPPPCNSLPLRRRRDHDSVEDQNEDQKDPQRSKVGDQDFVREELNTDSVPKVEDQSDPFAKLKSSGGVASLTDREIFDMWLAMRGGKTCSSQEVADKMFSNFKESILDKPSTHADSVPKVEDQSDPFAKLKSSGGVASLTDREIFDMWLAMMGGKTYPDKQEEDKAYINFQQNIREEPADQDEYTYNCLSLADQSKEEIAKKFRKTGEAHFFQGSCFYVSKITFVLDREPTYPSKNQPRFPKVCP
ncbi:uncharacterized protein LOC123890530 isoform X5 [Trifolium pratense]|uniref:uncharacterized protein LOC123890530 isoform X5 n=1 Tax=Trifolium pratense TaxID=57577 RepID=UPI001E6975FB|nr:uncharacterized protein LOC123890530 isoform X5 [Trifolium pratense]